VRGKRQRGKIGLEICYCCEAIKDYLSMELLSHKRLRVKAKGGKKAASTVQKEWLRRLMISNREIRCRVRDCRQTTFSGSEKSSYKHFIFSVSFVLKKPFLSSDDVGVYVIDNPMRKEWVFQVPYIAGTQWKGMLRQALMRDLVNFHQEYRKNPTENPFASLLNLKNKTDLTTGELFARVRFRLFLLFGAEKESEPDQPREVTKFLNKAGGEVAQKRFRELVAEHFGCKDDPARLRVVLKRFRGRLVFLPTFFNRLGIEVLNPQDRATGAGKGPIWLETVPPGTKGELRILRVPFDLIALQKDEKVCDEEEKLDKAVMLFGIARLLGHYGIGAKTSTSFGLCRVATQWLRFLIEEARREAEEEAKRRQSSEIEKWFVQKLAEKIKEYVGRSNRVERRE